MVVLSIGTEPVDGCDELGKALGIPRDERT